MQQQQKYCFQMLQAGHVWISGILFSTRIKRLLLDGNLVKLFASLLACRCSPCCCHGQTAGRRCASPLCIHG